MSEPLNRPPLHPVHVSLNAKLVPFAGWEMPLQYAGILAEHRAVRTAAGIFDVSHMGRIEVSGPQAQALLNQAITMDIEAAKPGRARYGLLCLESGGILDDAVTLKLDAQSLVLVCNASNRTVVSEHVQRLAAMFYTTVTDITLDTAMLALQGPSAAAMLGRLGVAEAATMPFFGCARTTLAGADVLLSRTGYTGEDGFEIICPKEDAVTLWPLLVQEGAAPCGLGARDVLRLEACLPLYGNDMDAAHNPWEADLDRFVDLRKSSFVGREALLESLRRGVQRKLVAFQSIEKGSIPRHGHPILADGTAAGVVTSGTYSPSLDRPIGLGYVSVALAAPGARLQVDVRGKLAPVEVVEKPLYRAKSKGGVTHVP